MVHRHHAEESASAYADDGYYDDPRDGGACHHNIYQNEQQKRHSPRVHVAPSGRPRHLKQRGPGYATTTQVSEILIEGALKALSDAKDKMERLSESRPHGGARMTTTARVAPIASESRYDDDRGDYVDERRYWNDEEEEGRWEEEDESVEEEHDVFAANVGKKARARARRPPPNTRTPAAGGRKHSESSSVQSVERMEEKIRASVSSLRAALKAEEEKVSAVKLEKTMAGAGKKVAAEAARATPPCPEDNLTSDAGRKTVSWPKDEVNHTLAAAKEAMEATAAEEEAARKEAMVEEEMQSLCLFGCGSGLAAAPDDHDDYAGTLAGSGAQIEVSDFESEAEKLAWLIAEAKRDLFGGTS